MIRGRGSAPPLGREGPREGDSGKRKRTSSGDLSVLRRLWAQMHGWRRWLVVILVLDLLSTPLGLLSPVPLVVAVDYALGDKTLPAFTDFLPDAVTGSTSSLLLLAGVLQVLVALLTGLRAWVSNVVKVRVGEQITLGVRGRMLARAQQLSFRYHDRAGTADSIYRIQYDAPAMASVGISGLLPFISAAFTLVSMVLVVWRISAPLALVSLSITPVLMVSARLYRSRMRPRYKQVKRLESNALGVVQEIFSAFRVVKAFNMESEEEERFVTQSRMSADARVTIARQEGAFTILTSGVTAAGTGLVIIIGGGNVASGAMTIGALILVISYLGQIYAPLYTLTNQLAKLQSQLVSAERALELLGQEPEVVDPPDGLPLTRTAGRFEFRDARFEYEPGHPVLADANLVIPAGSRVGIVGRTGAGKSTLVSLLMRFYDVTSGAITLDGHDLRRYRLADLRRQFAMVLQDPFLFSTSIRDNIAFGRPGASREEIEAAARAAGIHDAITQLPDGYDTLVGERGMRLSGGERQRISIARAFLRDSPVLLLDEPTSSVDQQTEAEILSAMEDLMADRTTFIIAHRLTTLRTCTMILSIMDGRIVRLSAAEHQDLILSQVNASARRASEDDIRLREHP